MRTVNEFGLTISTSTQRELIDYLGKYLPHGKRSMVISGVNAHAVVSLYKNSSFKEGLKRSSIINIDGMSVVMALRFLGYKVAERVACPDLFHDMLNLASVSGYGVYFVGAREDILHASMNKLQQRYPALNILGYRSGYFQEHEEQSVIDEIVSKKPQMLFLAMPSPKKENFALRFAQTADGCIMLGIGGVLDIEAGMISRAPKWMQNLGLEWLYRLLQEPKRMWKRYLLGNIEFIYIVCKIKLKHSYSQWGRIFQN